MILNGNSCYIINFFLFHTISYSATFIVGSFNVNTTLKSMNLHKNPRTKHISNIHFRYPNAVLTVNRSEKAIKLLYTLNCHQKYLTLIFIFIICINIYV